MLTLDTQPALQGAPNFRDIGGYGTKQGRALRRGLIYRSDRLAALTPADLEVIGRLGIRTVCDLRSATERSMHPNLWPAGQAFDAFNCEILTDVRAADGATFEPLRRDPTPAGARRMVIELYRAMPAAFAPHLAGLIARIVEGGLPLLIHCTAGKDRTGFAVAVLHAVLGVPREDIYRDYLLTQLHSQRKERIAHVTELITAQLGHAPDPGIITTMLNVDADYLAIAFETLETAHGSVEAYLLQACRVEEAQLQRLREALLD